MLVDPQFSQRFEQLLRYIDTHLEAELSLAELAGRACYSPFHFHRLFKSITGETLLEYVTRKRVERAALLLLHQPELRMADIATQLGFQSDATFSRTFSKAYGQSPSAFRKQYQGQYRKIGKTQRKNEQESAWAEAYFRHVKQLQNWMHMHAQPYVAQRPALHLAYLPHTGVEGIENSFQKALLWAQAHQLLIQPNIHMCRAFHDSFKVTEAHQVRMSIGVAAPSPLPTDGGMHALLLPEGKYLVGHFTLHIPEFEQAWTGLFMQLHELGLRKAEGAPYELYLNNPSTHPEGKCEVVLCIPVK